MKNEKSLNVLVVEDDKLNAEILRKFIKSNVKVSDIEVQTIHNADSILDEIKKSEMKPHVVILSEPSLGKIKFASEIPSRINQIKKVNPLSEVIVLATPDKVVQVIDTFRSGAFDVVLKDEHTEKNVVNSLHRYLNRQDENIAVKKQTALVNAH